MLNPRLIGVEVHRPYELTLRFEGGVSATVDLAAELAGPIFEPLRDPAYFGLAFLNPELNTVCWPNGADLSPEFLHERCRQALKAA